MKNKTYYDLTKQEKKKYESEFLKTYVGKSVFDIAIGTQIVTIIMELLFIISLIIDGNIFLEDPKFMLNYFFMLTIITIINFLPSIYVNINFSGWLKNKYAIKRW